MARGVNKVILLGNLGKDPEVKYTPSGMAIARFSLATTERAKDKEGNWQDKTEWHNLVAFGRTAEVAGEYLKKGRTVYIEGALRHPRGTTKKQDRRSTRPRSSSTTWSWLAVSVRAAKVVAAIRADVAAQSQVQTLISGHRTTQRLPRRPAKSPMKTYRSNITTLCCRWVAIG